MLLACSGADTEDLLGQIAILKADLAAKRESNPDTDALVSITIGANDYDFSNPAVLAGLMCAPEALYRWWVQRVAAQVQENVEIAL